MMLTHSDSCDPGLTARDRRNRRPLVLCVVLWVTSFAAAHLFLPRTPGTAADEPMWGWGLIGLCLVLGVMLARYYLRFVRGLDEMMRRLHIEALAAGFGVAFVFGMGADLIGQMGVPRISSVTWAVMVLTYSIVLGRLQRAHCA